MLFTTLWVITGMILGWTAPEILVAKYKVHIPVPVNMMLAFVGGLIAYTIVR